MADNVLDRDFAPARPNATWSADREHTLVAAVNVTTAEVKNVLAYAPAASAARVLAVGFRR